MSSASPFRRLTRSPRQRRVRHHLAAAAEAWRSRHRNSPVRLAFAAACPERRRDPLWPGSGGIEAGARGKGRSIRAKKPPGASIKSGPNITAKTRVGRVLCSGRCARGHDVSIRMTPPPGGRCCGVMPAAKVSTTIVRPPQQGSAVPVSLPLLRPRCGRRRFPSLRSRPLPRRAVNAPGRHEAAGELGAVEGDGEKEPQRRHRTIGRRRPHAGLGLVQLEAAQIVGRRRIRRAAEERCKGPDVT